MLYDEDTQNRCSEKMAFDTKKEAVTAATVAHYQHQGQRLKVYRCRQCNLWHLASDWAHEEQLRD